MRWHKRRFSRSEVAVLLSRAQWDLIDRIAHDNGYGRYTWKLSYGCDVRVLMDVVQETTESVMEGTR